MTELPAIRYNLPQQNQTIQIRYLFNKYSCIIISQVEHGIEEELSDMYLIESSIRNSMEMEKKTSLKIGI